MTDDSVEVPDFSGDDFANDKEIVKARKEAQAYNQMIEDSLAILKNKLNVRESSHKNFKSFVMFKNLQPTVLDSFQSFISSAKLIVSVAEYRSSYPTARHSNTGSDRYLFGYLEFSKNFPHAYICRESITERVMSLFVKTDIDFSDHKKFSRKFNVVTKDAEKFTELVRFRNLNELTSFPEMEVEIHNNSCLFRNSRRPISLKEATDFSSLAKALANIFN